MVERSRYSQVAIWLHWIIAIAVITNIGLAGLTEDLPREVRGVYMGYHKALGVTILVLSVARLLWRLGHKPPPLPNTTPVWQAAFAKTIHFLFYVLLIGLPLSGWIWMSSAPAPFSYFGLFEVPLFPVAGQKALGDALHSGHELAGTAMFFLIILHLLAAAKHQFIDKDNLIRRMWPV